MNKQNQSELVPVIKARDIIEAEFYKSLLTSQDIPAFILDENSETFGMPMSILNQGVPVLVPAEFKAEAERIISEQAAVDEVELTREAESAEEE